jgi:hypothetical protein
MNTEKMEMVVFQKGGKVANEDYIQIEEELKLNHLTAM